MPKSKVVPIAHRHTLTRGDGMKTYQLGDTTVHIDETYLLTRTPEQAKADQEQLDAAMWAVVDELQARGETA